MKDNRGSVTIEATISLLVIMTVVLTFASFIRVVHIHSVMQHALVQTANEMAEYAYFTSILGLGSLNSQAVGNAEGAQAAISNNIDIVTDITSSINANMFPDLTTLGDLQLDDALGNIAWALMGELYDEVKTQLLNPITGLVLKTYLPGNADDYLKKNHLEGGFAGIDFSQSRYFRGDNGRDIEIVAIYNVKFFSPIPIIDKVTIVQTAKARAYASE